MPNLFTLRIKDHFRNNQKKTPLPTYRVATLLRNFAGKCRKMNRLNLKLFLSFFKIGAFTFGGGWAMIALLEKDIVDKYKWLEKEEFIDLLAVSQSLPGIMAVNVAISVGYKLSGLRGSISAALGTILPSFIIILAIAMFLTPETIKNNPTLTSIFMGIRPAVVALILAPVFTTAKSAKINKRNFFIPFIIAFMIWIDVPNVHNIPFSIVSSPVFYIILGGIFGYATYKRNFNSIKKKGDNNA